VLKSIKDQTLSFPKIDRPKKNEKLSIERKKEIIAYFNKWKNKFSVNL
jgi:hypothetical protein